MAAAGVVGRLSIESRGTFRVVEVCGAGSYSIQPFDKPAGAVRKIFDHDLYALPPKNYFAMTLAFLIFGI